MKGFFEKLGWTRPAFAMDSKSLRSIFAKDPTDSVDLQFMGEVDAALHRRGHRWAYTLCIFLLLLFFAFIVWAWFTDLDEATRGQGQVIPSQGVQLIQNQEGGTVLEVAVHESQVVEAGDLLARIDTTGIASSLRDLANKKAEHEVALIRLQAELDGKAPEYMQETLARYPEAVAGQLEQYRTRKEQFDGEDRALQAQVEQSRREVEEAQARKKQLEDSLLIVKQQEAQVRPLAERGVYSKLDYLNLKQRVVGLEGDLAGAAQTVARSQSRVNEAEERMNNRHAERRSASADEMSKRRAELNTLTEQIAAGGSRARRADLRAPMKGIIKRISVKQNAVAKPGETIMELLPIEDTLEVEARIRPADIGFLHPGQRAMVKVSAYDFAIYGGLEADLIQISADTIEDKRGEPFYLVRLRTRKNALVHNGETLPIIPGMTVNVDILTGEKTVLDYLLKPLMKSRQNALRERR